ncbi:MAG: hypothetical protein IIB15_08855 [Chloroflexi bacterium]|nr:hypothetical protein [Chloroflexota bacterium]
MKVLFVCHANVGRSQVAQVYFDKLSKHESDSAGMGVDENVAKLALPSRKLRDIPTQRSVVYIQREFGVDASENESAQLTLEMIDEADRVIIINEKERWLDYVKEGGKVVHWDIPDSLGMEDDSAFDVYRQIRERVEELVREIG